MNNTEEEQLAERLRSLNMPVQVGEIQAEMLPYRTFREIVDGLACGKLALAILFHSVYSKFLMGRRDRIIVDLISLTILLPPVACLVLSIWSHHYLVLLGIVTWALSFLLSSPLATKWRERLSRFSILLAVGLLSIHWTFSFIPLSFFAGSIIAVLIREFVNSVVKRGVSSSEVIFCAGFLLGIVLLQNKRSNQIFGKMWMESKW